MPWGECRYVGILEKLPHTKVLDEDRYCPTCAVLRTKIHSRLAAGLVPRPDDSADLAVDPAPSTLPGDCAACGDPFYFTNDDRETFRGLDGRYWVVHESCKLLLDAAE